MPDNKDINSIPMSNSAINMLSSLMNGSASLSQNYGKRKMSTTSRSSGKIKGLQSLKPGLGKQFSSGTSLEDLLE